MISAMAEQARRVDYVHATQFCTEAMEAYAVDLTVAAIAALRA